MEPDNKVKIDINDLPPLNTAVQNDFCQPEENIKKNVCYVLYDNDDKKTERLISKTILYDRRANISEIAKPSMRIITYVFKNLILVNLPTFAEINAEYSDKAIRENLYTPDYKDFKITWNLNDQEDFDFFSQINRRFIYLGAVIIQRIPLENTDVNNFLRNFFPNSTRWFSFNKYGENRDSYRAN